MKLEYLSLYHYVCEQLEIILFFFWIHLYNPAANEKMRYSRIRFNPYGGGGGGSIRKLWPLGIPDIIQSKLEYAGMKLEYLSYITMYVNI